MTTTKNRKLDLTAMSADYISGLKSPEPTQDRPFILLTSRQQYILKSNATKYSKEMLFIVLLPLLLAYTQASVNYYDTITIGQQLNGSEDRISANTGTLSFFKE
jgi:hypothetical protein